MHWRHFFTFNFPFSRRKCCSFALLVRNFISIFFQFFLDSFHFALLFVFLMCCKWTSIENKLLFVTSIRLFDSFFPFLFPFHSEFSVHRVQSTSGKIQDRCQALVIFYFFSFVRRCSSSAIAFFLFSINDRKLSSKSSVSLHLHPFMWNGIEHRQSIEENQQKKKR